MPGEHTVSGAVQNQNQNHCRDIPLCSEHDECEQEPAAERLHRHLTHTHTHIHTQPLLEEH